MSNNDESSIYAPIRLRNTYYWNFAKSMASHGYIMQNGMTRGNAIQMISDDLVEPILGHMIESPEHYVNEDSNVIGPIAAKTFNLRHWVPLIAQYELNGRQIFDLENRLVDLLTHTDVNECTIDNINLPYDCFYIRFGKQDHIKLEYDDDYEFLEGAFIAKTPYDATSHRLKIGFSTVLADGTGLLSPGYYIDFNPEEMQLPFEKAIDAAFARKVQSYTSEIEDNQNSRALAQHRIFEAEESVSLIKAGASLIINSLFYLESIRDKLPKKSPGRDTPEHLAKSAMNGKESKRESKLYSNGYTLVNLVGSEFEHSIVATVSPGTKSAHWRRGHWRNQRYGENNALVKRIWLKPVMISAELADGDSLKGHIYKSSDPDMSL